MIELVSPRENFIREVAARLQPKGKGEAAKDYSRSWVVFPERRPAYYLRKALAEREQTSFIPPVLESMDGFVGRVYEERLGKRDRLIDPLDAVALLFEIQRGESGFVHEHFMTADSFFPLGMKIFHDLEELCLAGATTVQVRELDLSPELDEKPSAQARGRLQSLASFYEQFYAAVKERGYSTIGSRSLTVLDGLKPELFADIETIVFAGFYSLSKVELKIIRTMMNWDHCFVLLLRGKGIESVLRELGPEGKALIGKAEDEIKGPGPEIEFIRSPDTHGQIFALNRALEEKTRDGAELDEKHAIVLPAAETLFPLYQQKLTALAGDQFNISMGYPLSRTPIYTFFDLLLELVQSRDEDGRLYAPHYLRFVLHPYTKNIYFPAAEHTVTGEGAEEKRADLTRILFHAIEDELTQGRRRTKSFWKLAELETDEAIRKAVQEKLKAVEDPPDVASLMDHLSSIHAQTVGPFGEIRDVGDFSGKMARVLDYIYKSSTARLHHFFHPFAEAFTRRLDDLENSLLRDVRFEDRSAYFNLFRKVIAAGTVPFEGTPLRGLQVLGFWEARCIPFEDVSFLDVNEDVLPSFRREDTLLPMAARTRLGLPTYQDNERRMEYYLDTIVRGARKVRIFFVENNDKERSRFVEKLIWEKQKRERERDGEKLVRTVQYRVALTKDETKPVEKRSAVAEYLKTINFSATALDMYLRCPLQLYYSKVLGIEEREEIGEQMEKKDIGSFVHDVLEEYFKRFAGQAVRERDLDAGEMKRLIARKFEESYGGDMAGNAYLLKLQVERHLEEFLLNYQAPVIRDLASQGKALVLFGLEQVLQCEIHLNGDTFKLVGRLDRSEKRGQDIFILDYKTGANEKYVGINFKKLVAEDRETWNEAIGSVQIPFYNCVYGWMHHLAPESIQGRFLMLGKSHLSPEIEFSPYDKDENVRAGQVQTMEKIISALVREIVDPARPFEPSNDRGRTCPSCPYGYLCNRR